MTQLLANKVYELRVGKIYSFRLDLCNDDHLTAVYLAQPAESALQLSEILTQYTTLIVLKFLTSTTRTGIYSDL